MGRRRERKEEEEEKEGAELALIQSPVSTL
jgi:hypothetical protein